MLVRKLAALAVCMAAVWGAGSAHAQEGGGLLGHLFKKRPAAEQSEAAIKAEPAKRQQPQLVLKENTGELRSEEAQVRRGLFGKVLGINERLLPETSALDSRLRDREARKPFRMRDELQPRVVSFPGYKSGTIVIDTGARYLYLVESFGKARRYAIAVGREGLEFKGKAVVGDKQEWPRWFPTKAMQEREPRKYGRYKDGMNGGPDNPLGARAIYLYQGKRDTHVRIHGTNQPETIGTNSSNGCFRMINEQVIDLYRRVPKGAEVVVL